MCPYNKMIYNPLDIYPVMGLLGQMEFLFLGPWGIATLSSTMVELIYTPNNNVKCSYFSTSSLAPVVSRFFDDRHSNWCEMVSQCSFDLHFSNNQWLWALFICLLSPYISSFEKCLFISFTHFWMGLFAFSCKPVWVLCKFWISALCQMGKLQKFFPILLVADPL